MDETWSALAADDVVAEFNADEQTAIGTAKGGRDDLQTIVDGVVDQVRDAYRSGGRLLDTTDGTIPDGLKRRAIAIARWKFILSIPKNADLQSDERKAANDEAEAYLTSIAKREIKGEGGAAATSQPRQMTRCRLNGLI